MTEKDGLMGNYTYYCVSCGEEIAPKQIADKMMISLSYAALDGVPDTVIEKNPVYVTRGELERLINRKDASGRQYLTLEEYLMFAYSGRNNKQALAPRIIRSFVDAFKNDGGTLKEREHASDETDAYSDQDETGEFVLPGFGDTAVNQIRENFPNGVCWLNWTINETKGYLYKLIFKNDAVPKITPYWVCSNFKEEILADAFEHRQILIGLLGFVSAGKTCLIASMCRLLIEQGGILMAAKKVQNEYKEVLLNYEGGYALDKTSTEGANAYHPSVLKDDILWTFVDIPGETFFHEDKQDIDDKMLVKNPKIQMSLKCHAYILTADQRIVQDSMLRSDALKTFQSFINFAEAFGAASIKGSPLMFALTKVDETEKDLEKTNLPSYCIQDSYTKAFRRELSIIRNTGLGAFVDELAKRNYLAALTCAPYGFPPLPCDNPTLNIFTQRDSKEAWKQEYRQKHPEVEEKMMPHPAYRKAQPRNADMILSWLERLFGVQKIIYDNISGTAERKDLSTISRYDGHFDDVTVSMIASMFCNPNKWDTEWYVSMGDSSFFRKRKQRHLMKEYESAKRMR